MSSRPTSPAPRLRRRLAVVALGAGLLVGAVSGTASAKAIAGTGTTGPGATCNPVTSLSYKGDARAGETGVTTITVAYGVKACTNGQAVTADAKVFLSADPTVVPYQASNIALSGKFVVSGVKVNTSYQATITVRDASTGALVGTQTIFVAAKTKPV